MVPRAGEEMGDKAGKEEASPEGSMRARGIRPHGIGDFG